MKPLLLKFCAFGPYAEEQIIDFKALSETGLFLIHGETGSGKTVILDAITYALYGESSGGIRGGLAAMRCQLADEANETYTEFTFEVNSKIYTFSRGLRTVHKRNGDTELSPTQAVFIHDEDGAKQPVFENPKASAVKAEAQRLIGLDYEQFRQIIILPQGQFEKLLIAESGEKEQILSTLFGAAKWDTISEYISAQSAGAKASLNELKAQINHILGESECENVECMADLCEKAVRQVQCLTEEKKICEEKLEKATSEYDNTKVLYDVYTKHNQLSAELENLNGRAQLYSEKEQLLKRHGGAMRIKSVYDEYINSEKLCEKRKQALSAAKDRADAAETEFEKAQSAQNTLAEKENERERSEKRLTVLENMRGVYEKIDDSRELTERLQSEYDAAASALEQAEREQSELEQRRAALEIEQATLYEQYIELFRSSGAAQMLASELEDGQPCPVCGSIHHPNKARRDDDFSGADLADKQNQIDEVSTQLKSVRDECEQTDTDVQAKKKAAQTANDEYMHAEASYRALRANASDEFDTLESLCDAIKAIESEISEYKAECERVKKRMDNARAELSAAQAVFAAAQIECDNAVVQYEKSEKAFENAIGDGGFADCEDFCECMLSEEAAAALEEEITVYKEECAALKKNISLMTDVPEKCPDIESVQTARDTAQSDMADISARLALAADEKNRTEEKYKKLCRLDEKLKKTLPEYEKLAFFAESIAGSKGISLKRYILGVMLSAVTEQANKMLSRVHGGRYRLYRRDDSNSKAKKLGLGLEVYDSYSGKRRDVATLSGGEKFLVSLALSIGLSARAQLQSGGIRTEAMFIDEGFGTLDSGSVGDALDILAGMRGDSSVIGIISHIPALRESISSCIAVEKSKTGSRLSVYL